MDIQVYRTSLQEKLEKYEKAEKKKKHKKEIDMKRIQRRDQ